MAVDVDAPEQKAFDEGTDEEKNHRTDHQGQPESVR